MDENKSKEENPVSIRLSPRQEKRLEKSLCNQKHNVVNVVEIIACEELPEVMIRMDMCTCEKCTSDVLALALNMLPTKYVTSDAGKQYIQLNSYKKQFQTDVEIAIMRACMLVKDSPNHSEI